LGKQLGKSLFKVFALGLFVDYFRFCQAIFDEDIAKRAVFV
jgi:hypothetical protein